MSGKTGSLIVKGEWATGQIMRASIGAGVLITALMTGCASTNISSVWKDQSYMGTPHKIMIIGISKKPANKRTLEDEFVKQIIDLGSNAVVSYTILPEDKDTNKELVAAKVKDLGADAVLITRIASRKTVYTNHQGGEYSPPVYYGSWQNYYEYGRSSVFSADYVEETKYALIETNLYDAVTDKLIWSASSETEITGSDQKFIKIYVKAMVKNMAEQKLLR